VRSETTMTTLRQRNGLATREATVAPTRFIVEDHADVCDENIASYTGTVRPHPRRLTDASLDVSRLIMDGKGVATCANGDVYDGDTRLGMFEGMGVMRYTDGAVYDGQWAAHLRHGYGVLDSPRGTTSYVGLFRRGEKDGTGEETSADGFFAGTYHDGAPRGLGRFVAKNGDVYDGVYEDGDLTGLATVTYAHGDFYVGRFINGQPHGGGTYTQVSTGDEYAERFDEGVCVSGVCRPLPGGACHCAVLYHDGGSRYSGGWVRSAAGTDRRGVREGRGVLTLPNGDVYDGEFAGDHFGGEAVVTYAAEPAGEAGSEDSGDEDSDAGARGDFGCLGEIHGSPGASTMASDAGDGASGDEEDDSPVLAGELRDTTAFDERHCGGVRVLRFEGAFHDGVRDGRGRLYLADGDVFEGFWSKGRRHGVFHQTTGNRRARTDHHGVLGTLETKSEYYAFDRSRATLAVAEAVAAESCRAQVGGVIAADADMLE
jgi:hypothetical protein